MLPLRSWDARTNAVLDVGIDIWLDVWIDVWVGIWIGIWIGIWVKPKYYLGCQWLCRSRRSSSDRLSR